MAAKKTKVDVLGTTYTIEEKSSKDDKYLERCDGYCDKTTKRIVVAARREDCEVDCFEDYQKKVKRHELVHAFLFESGLHENWKHDEFGHDESYVDWIAAQFPKLLRAFEQAGCL